MRVIHDQIFSAACLTILTTFILINVVSLTIKIYTWKKRYSLMFCRSTVVKRKKKIRLALDTVGWVLILADEATCSWNFFCWLYNLVSMMIPCVQVHRSYFVFERVSKICALDEDLDLKIWTPYWTVLSQNVGPTW